MLRNILLFNYLFLSFFIFTSCNPSKNSIHVKLNDIDSAIRVVIPSHNCGCNWQDRKSNLYLPPLFKNNNYIWQAIFVKSIDSVDVINDSKKVLQQLIKLDSRFSSISRFFLEYKIQERSDSLQYKTVGTWYNFNKNCNGYISGITALELEKNTIQNNDRIKLCK